MPSVTVRILNPDLDPAAGSLGAWVHDVRGRLAEHHRRGFVDAQADDVTIVSGPPDHRSFGDRLQRLIEPRSGAPGGLVVLGSGSIPLATAADRRAFVSAARDDRRRVLANNYYSADVVAISRIDSLPAIPALPSDNALPRWLDEVAGYPVEDLRSRWRLGFDIDGPLDLILLGARAPRGLDLGLVGSRLAASRAVAGDPRAELLVSGRTSATALGWIEGHAAARVRAWVEERGLHAGSRLAQAAERGDVGASRARPPRSVLGTLLDRDGPGALGDHLARFADAALVDTRVLLAHHLGSDPSEWPSPEDRAASDLLLAERIADPWLRELTQSAIDAPIPILLGGHTLVGPGVRMVIDGPPASLPWT
ncbi:MAG: hypothetical protein QOI37_1341 [Chloroflexota bacterium]|nr:hypothetical protein [Chloroflexota bacterium]